MNTTIEKVKERPILFSTPMVKAILEGRKTVTRRIMNPQHETESVIGTGVFNPIVIDRNGDQQPGPDTFGAICDDGEFCLKCPYGQPGDVLWVRETWAIQKYFNGLTEESFPIYRTDYPGPVGWNWKPSIFMPREACRIKLKINSINVELLHDITEEDCEQEGAEPMHCRCGGGFGVYEGGGETWDCECQKWPHDRYKMGFMQLWFDINGAESWNSNPWVWRIEFEKIKG
jgi:hypothetical protein